MNEDKLKEVSDRLTASMVELQRAISGAAQVAMNQMAEAIEKARGATREAGGQGE